MNCSNCSTTFPGWRPTPYNITAPGQSLSRLSVQVWAAVTSILSLSGASATGVVSCVVWKVNTGSKWLILNYLLLHFVTSAINVPVNVYMTALKNLMDRTPPNFCPPFQFLYFSTESAIDWANLCLTVHRIFAARFPATYPSLTRRPVVLSMIGFVWIAATCPNIPALFHLGGYYLVTPAGRCGLKQTNQAVMVPLYTTATLLPFVLSVMSAFYLSFVLVRMQLTTRQRIQPKPLVGVRRGVKLTWALLTAVLIDALCIKSWSVIGLYFPMVFVRQPLISLLTRTSVVLAATLAPIMICVMNGDNRRRLMRFASALRRNKSVISSNKPRIARPTSLG